jgi:WD40 repeat protein
MALFISHSSQDQAATERVCDRLRAQGLRALFVDFDPEQGIPAGRNWERELYSQVRRADAVLFLSSPAAVRSRWCFAEVALARLLGKPVFPIVIVPGPRHPLLTDVQEIDLTHRGDAALDAQLMEGLRHVGLDPDAMFPWDGTRPPYPGLSAFAEEDAGVFFGRGPETKRLLELLQPTLESRGRFIAVVGPSGSGKSSLVHAGLLPRLARLPQRWLVIPPLVPSTQPVRQLARSLAHAFKDRGIDWSPAKLAPRLARGAPALVELVEELRDTSTGKPPSVLLVIDQAEELATLTGPGECAAFLDLLHGVVHDTVAVWVLATMRVEFLGSLLQQPGTADQLDEVLPVSPLDRARLFAVIEGPADRAGLRFASGLAGRLVEDTQGGDALPLLAFTLRQLAERAGPEGQITTEVYEASGGVVGALRVQADKVAQKLDHDGHGELIVPTLMELATITDEGELTRRRMPRSAFTGVQNEVIQAFIEARLLISHGHAHSAVVEVAHEALLRQWPRLRQAIEERRSELRLRTELERWVQDWERSGRQDSYLVGAERLQEFERLAADHPHEIARLAGAKEFLKRSARQQRVTMQRKTHAIANRALAELRRDPELGTLLAIAATEETDQSPRAILALSNALATSYIQMTLRGQMTLLHTDMVPGVALSPDGTRLFADGDIWDARSGELLLSLGSRGIGAVAFSPDGTRIAAARNRKGADIWDANSGAHLLALDHHGKVEGVAFSPDGAHIATVLEDGPSHWDYTARIWDARSGAQLRTLGHGEDRAIAYSPDGTRIAAASGIWDASSGKHLLSLDSSRITGSSRVTSKAFSPDGTCIATASGNSNIVQFWDTATGAPLRQIAPSLVMAVVNCVALSPDGTRIATSSSSETASGGDYAVDVRLLPTMPRHAFGHINLVKGVAFSPDGTRIATASADDTAAIWDATSGVQLHTLGHGGSVYGVAFSADSTRVATASHDHTVGVWDAFSGRRRRTLRHENMLLSPYKESLLWDVAFSPDGTRIVFASEAQGAYIWNLKRGKRRLLELPHPQTVTGVAFSPNGTQIVTACADEAAYIWDLSSREEPLELRHEGPVGSVTFSLDGTRIATASSDGTAGIWNAATGERLLIIRHEGAVLDVAFSPDGTSVATASSDGTVRLWEVASGEEFLVFRHKHAVEGVAFSPDGGRLVTASGDAAWLWDVEADPTLLLAKAKARVGRELTKNERRLVGLL